MITGIGHSAYNVSDMEKSLKYYCDGLGFTHAFSLQREGKPWIEYLHIAGMQFVELFYADQIAPPEGISYAHLCLNVDDAEKTCKELEARGVIMTSQPRQGSDGNTQFWSKDPDGNRIEFMQMSPTSDQAKAAARIGK